MPSFEIQFGDSPLVAAAIHDGHAIRAELQPHLALPEADRLREEDPFTAGWTSIAPTRIVGLRSRFECDLNRPREKAVYQTPEDCWGLCVWKQPLPPAAIERSLAIHDLFYEQLHALLSSLVARAGRVVVFDLHSYNHCRGGPGNPPADPRENPEVNLGTGTMNRQHWAPVIERCLAELRNFELGGGEVPSHRLDVRENVRFFGGYFPRWIHEHFPDSACVLSLEFKKTFMDEWTSQPAATHLAAISAALGQAAAGVLEELARLTHNGGRSGGGM